MEAFSGICPPFAFKFSPFYKKSHFRPKRDSHVSPIPPLREDIYSAIGGWGLVGKPGRTGSLYGTG